MCTPKQAPGSASVKAAMRGWPALLGTPEPARKAKAVSEDVISREQPAVFFHSPLIPGKR